MHPNGFNYPHVNERKGYDRFELVFKLDFLPAHDLDSG